MTARATQPDLDPIMVLSPRELAADMIATFRDNMKDRDRYAVHRAAEVRAWELHKASGGNESTRGRQFAKAACEIAEYYHDVAWRDQDGNHHVPLLA